MKDFDSSNLVANVLTSPSSQLNEVKNQESARAIEKPSKSEKEAAGEEGSQLDTQKNRQQLVDEVKQNLEKLNEFIPVTSTNLSFEFDEDGDPPFIRVIDRDNDKVIREIPSEEFRAVAKALDEFADKLNGKGFLFDRTA
ncbi:MULTISPECIES: flagellar protein FlaG [Pseudoalteromonas]|uniref:Flagellar biosynthesis protein FlaG n=1 Tax=Pseudoalteromonas amylolytica TaxID=1859457 RepID=A0A1S1MTY4_9GAMM|nr:MULTISPECIES: flagellar protein FlaG [Pseudoalteromonas]MCF6434676.1 flagellar protein FlaG [Pseudoalteromonas sp. MMG022]OHU87549.1 flagellar biosynthesis protein FlaG [Pseudoalteromonas sp. JW3]OHU90992.1 flagellar biosynthesis protein FlaG [Pseudoalteromonas amylolytica]